MDVDSLFYVAATFFCAYEFTRSVIGAHVHERHAPFVDMLAAAVGEVVYIIIYVQLFAFPKAIKLYWTWLSFTTPADLVFGESPV